MLVKIKLIPNVKNMTSDHEWANIKISFLVFVSNLSLG
jgi:hypothetical protein